MSVSIQIKDRDVRDLLRKIEKAGPEGRKIAAHTAARATQDHFAKLSRARHRAAAGMNNYYARAAKATTGRVQGDQVIVSIDALGLALRRYGGTVTPKRAKYLAIPSSDNPAAINNAPRRVPGLHFRRNKNGDGGRLTDNTGRVFYWLVKKSVHQPDPSVLPSAGDFDKAIMPILKAHIDRM
jgi:hypothetical protein